MHRLGTVIAIATVLIAGCTPVVRSSLRVTPMVTPDLSTTAPSPRPADAMAAVERLAVRFGLKLDENKGPTGPKTWRGPAYTSNRAQRLRIYAHLGSDGAFNATVSESATTQWSPRGDSLRQALADTLTCFGVLATKPPNER